MMRFEELGSIAVTRIVFIMKHHKVLCYACAWGLRAAYRRLSWRWSLVDLLSF